MHAEVQWIRIQVHAYAPSILFSAIEYVVLYLATKQFFLEKQRILLGIALCVATLHEISEFCCNYVEFETRACGGRACAVFLL